MTNAVDPLIGSIRADLQAGANPDRAVEQQAYMKSALPYFGLALPDVRRITRLRLREHPIADQAQLETTVRTLIDEAGHREEWYAAMEIWGRDSHSRWRTPRSLPLIEHVVVTTAWWDIVDDIAGHVVSPLLRSHSPQVQPTVRLWADADNLWLRRVAILSQLGAKDELNRTLLADVIEPNLDRREFFIRKAVGWALRDASAAHPEWVRNYVDQHAQRLSPLSTKEATRRLPPHLTT